MHRIASAKSSGSDTYDVVVWTYTQHTGECAPGYCGRIMEKISTVIVLMGHVMFIVFVLALLCQRVEVSVFHFRELQSKSSDRLATNIFLLEG